MFCLHFRIIGRREEFAIFSIEAAAYVRVRNTFFERFNQNGSARIRVLWYGWSRIQQNQSFRLPDRLRVSAALMFRPHHGNTIEVTPRGAGLKAFGTDSGGWEYNFDQRYIEGTGGLPAVRSSVFSPDDYQWRITQTGAIFNKNHGFNLFRTNDLGRTPENKAETNPRGQRFQQAMIYTTRNLEDQGWGRWNFLSTFNSNKLILSGSDLWERVGDGPCKNSRNKELSYCEAGGSIRPRPDDIFRCAKKAAELDGSTGFYYFVSQEGDFGFCRIQVDDLNLCDNLKPWDQLQRRWRKNKKKGTGRPTAGVGRTGRGTCYAHFGNIH